jgi:hypothetical protein
MSAQQWVADCEKGTSKAFQGQPASHGDSWTRPQRGRKEQTRQRKRERSLTRSRQRCAGRPTGSRRAAGAGTGLCTQTDNKLRHRNRGTAKGTQKQAGQASAHHIKPEEEQEDQTAGLPHSHTAQSACLPMYSGVPATSKTTMRITSTKNAWYRGESQWTAKQQQRRATHRHTTEKQESANEGGIESGQSSTQPSHSFSHTVIRSGQRLNDQVNQAEGSQQDSRPNKANPGRNFQAHERTQKVRGNQEAKRLLTGG